VGFVPCVKQALGFGLVSGAQAGLLAAAGVFDIEYGVTSKQDELCFHNSICRIEKTVPFQRRM
jgi:hypothetical protein